MQADKFRALCQMAVMNAKTLDDMAALSVNELYSDESAYDIKSVLTGIFENPKTFIGI